MFRKGVIHVGDTTSHGGTVMTGSSAFMDDGKPVSCVGDSVQCPIHGLVTILEGDSTVTHEGKPVSYEGCRTSCGATLMQAQDGFTWLGSVTETNARRADIGAGHVPSRSSATAPATNLPSSLSAFRPPVVNMTADRRESIVNNTPAIFEIAENPGASSGKPLMELDIFDEVDGQESFYDEAGAEFGVDPDLLKAIGYMESTHGYYDRINPWNNSHRPMNIQYEGWKPLALELGLHKDEVVHFPRANIRMAALLVSRIQERIISPNPQKIASIYVFLGAENVSDYGARVRAIYENRLWESN